MFFIKRTITTDSFPFVLYLCDFAEIGQEKMGELKIIAYKVKPSILRISSEYQQL